MVFIGHDKHFIRSFATKLLHINNGKVTPFAGGYDYYLEKSGHKNAHAAVALHYEYPRRVNHEKHRSKTRLAAKTAWFFLLSRTYSNLKLL